MTLRRRICKTCKRPLNRVGTLEKGIWTHAIPPEDGGHAPVPVDPDEVADIKNSCDFCTGEPVVFTVKAESFELPGGLGRSEGDWAACAVCGVLVKRRRFVALGARAIKSMPPELQTDAKSVLGTVYARLQVHVTGVVPVAEMVEGTE